MKVASTVRRLVITGRVQGVGFRFSLADEARGRKLSGWVRNCADGSVEAMLAGAESDVDAMIAWAHHGPPSAKVDDVLVSAASGEFAGFDIAPTAR